MNINILQINNIYIAEVTSDNIIINIAQDALDIMAECSYQGATNIIFHEKNITPDFFDLKTKLAGEILQKFTNYGIRIAIVGDFSKFTSKSLKDFIYESNKLAKVNFVETSEKGIKILSKE